MRIERYCKGFERVRRGVVGGWEDLSAAARNVWEMRRAGAVCDGRLRS
ncbi:MAG TPA: hypothetical protein VGP99_09690 [Tepidisphaeraceae bacterium]|nr:hypothetical protein [Tepidisphaeraceae bacterium]